MFVRAVHAHVFVSPSLDIWRLEMAAEKGGDNISCSTCILTLSIYSGEIVGSSRIPELFWPPFQHLFRRILLRFNLDECICCPFLTPLPVPLLPQNVYLWRALPGHHVYIPAVKSPIGLKLTCIIDMESLIANLLDVSWTGSLQGWSSWKTTYNQDDQTTSLARVS